MHRKNRKLLPSYMRRHILYRTFTRVIIALTLALIWNFFVNTQNTMRLSFAFTFLGVFFGALAWSIHLRRDGVKIPRFDRALFDWKRKPQRMYGDMADYVDEEVESFDDLEPEEQETCAFYGDMICCILFLALSFIV